MEARRTATLVDLHDERWVVLADTGDKGKHMVHIIGRENLEIMYGYVLLERSRRANLDSKKLTDPFDTLEVSR